MKKLQSINIIFDGPPSHETGRFIEVELDDGKSINAGEWIKRNDGTWALHIKSLPFRQRICWSMKLKLISEIVYWIAFVAAALITIVLLVGCNSTTLDAYTQSRKQYMYDGNVYCSTEYFEKENQDED